MHIRYTQGGGRDLIADGVELSYGGNILLASASLRIAYARRYGVVGRNGVLRLQYVGCSCSVCVFDATNSFQLRKRKRSERETMTTRERVTSTTSERDFNNERERETSIIGERKRLQQKERETSTTRDKRLEEWGRLSHRARSCSVCVFDAISSVQ